MTERIGLGVNRVDCFTGNEYPADAAILVPRIEVVPLLIEDLEAVVTAIRHPKTTARIESQSMWRAKLAVERTDLSPLHKAHAIR